MSDTGPGAPAAPRWLAWMPAVALLLTIGGVISTSGGYISKQEDHTRRIEELERREASDREKRSEQIVDIRERTIRIEARLDALVPEDRRASR